MLCFGKLLLGMTVGEALESFDIRCSTVLFLLALSHERRMGEFCLHFAKLPQEAEVPAQVPRRSTVLEVKLARASSGSCGWK